MVLGPGVSDHTGGARRRVGPGLRRGYIGALEDRGKEAGELRPRQPGGGSCVREAALGGPGDRGGGSPRPGRDEDSPLPGDS